MNTIAVMSCSISFIGINVASTIHCMCYKEQLLSCIYWLLALLKGRNYFVTRVIICIVCFGSSHCGYIIEQRKTSVSMVSVARTSWVDLCAPTHIRSVRSEVSIPQSHRTLCMHNWIDILSQMRHACIIITNHLQMGAKRLPSVSLCFICPVGFKGWTS